MRLIVRDRSRSAVVGALAIALALGGCGKPASGGGGDAPVIAPAPVPADAGAAAAASPQAAMDRVIAELAVLPDDAPAEAHSALRMALLDLWQRDGAGVTVTPGVRAALHTAWVDELTYQEGLAQAKRYTAALETLDATADTLDVAAERPRLTALLGERGGGKDGEGGAVLDLLDQCREGAAFACGAALETWAHLPSRRRGEVPREDLVHAYARALELSERQAQPGAGPVEGALAPARLVVLAKLLDAPAALAERARALPR